MGDLYLEQRSWEFGNGLHVVPIPTMLHTPFHPGLFPMTPGLVGQPAVGEADVVQVGEFHQPSTFFASKAAQEAGVPLVLWQETFAPMRAPGSLYQRVFETTAGRRIRGILQASIPRTTKARAYLRRLGIPPESIAPWVPSGVDVETFAPRRSQHAPEDFGWQPDVRVLLLVARLDRTKGVDLALHALAAVRRSTPEIRLLVAGSGPELPNLRRLIVALRLEGEVRLLGRCSREELRSLFNMAEIILSTSRKDLLPFSLMEGSACGRPCVATDVGAVRDIVADGETGLVVRQSGAHALSDAILSLLRNEDLRGTFGAEARRRMEKYFAFPEVAKRLLEVYRGASA